MRLRARVGRTSQSAKCKCQSAKCLGAESATKTRSARSRSNRENIFAKTTVLHACSTKNETGVYHTIQVFGRLALTAALLLAVVTLVGCDQNQFSTVIVTAQVARTLNPESNTASVLVGTATIQNIFHDEWMKSPDPGDTSFWSNPFPASISPMADADVRLNSDPVGQKVSGVYFKAALDLNYLERYDLSIVTPEGKTITAHGFLPDSFSILGPRDGDSLRVGTDTLRAVWTKSDSAETYLVGVSPADTASPAVGWSDGLTDTTCIIPDAAFRDSFGVAVPGDYIFSITAVNGGWNKSGFDLFLSGGNIDGASGTFGCAVYPRPVSILAR
jgi:hypothetical protein